MKKTTAISIISVLTAAVIALGALALWKNGQLESSRRVNAIYGEEALGELESSLYSMDTALKQSLYATDSALASQLCGQAAAFGEASLTAIRSLPCVTHEMERLMSAVNTAGDYALSVSRSASRGTPPDEETRSTLSALSGTVSSLASQVTEIRAALAENALVLDDFAECSDEGRTNTVGSELRTIEAALPSPSALSYDGRYATVAKTSGAEPIDESEARKAAAAFLDLPEQRLISQGMSAGENALWWFTISMPEGEDARIGVNAASGKVSEWSSCRFPESGDLTEEEAKNAAAEFLAAHGLSDMAPLNVNVSEGLCEVTYAAKAGEALRLGSVTRITVDRQSGKVCAYMSSRSASAPPEQLTPAITPEQAAEGLLDSLAPQNIRLVTIESAGGREDLCWEISTLNAESVPVTVYVDAVTGGQEKIEIGDT